MIFFTLSANAGTGKTLLMYDIAKDFINKDKKILIIHCGKLNHGHNRLMLDYQWKVMSIRSVSTITSIVKNEIQDYSMVFIDESQRMHLPQINALTEAAVELKKTLLFSYDVKQYLKSGETLDVNDYLHKNYTQIVCETKKLTNKIRTNKELASFITNLIDIGKSKDHLDYSSVSIDYFDNDGDIVNYVDYLKSQGWIFITFTTSLKDPDTSWHIISC